jgi:hypothetical protein
LLCEKEITLLFRCALALAIEYLGMGNNNSFSRKTNYDFAGRAETSG